MAKETPPQDSVSIGGDAGVDIQVTKKQEAFMNAKEDEVLYGGAA